MRFGIAVSDPDDWTAKSLRNAFQKNGCYAEFLNFSMLSAAIGTEQGIRLVCNGANLNEFDGLVIRDLGRGKPANVAFRFEVLRALEEADVHIVNSPESIARAANKFATSLALKKAGVPTPATFVTSSYESAEEFLVQYKTAVFKPLFGYKGRGIGLLTEKDETLLRTILENQGIVYLQEFINLESPRDIRAFVVDGEVLGAIYRVAPPGAWISNLARGGKAESCPITEELKDMAVRASHAVSTVYCGVDLLETKEGLKVIEVNGTPSGKGIYEALRVDVTKAITNRIIGQ